jgi:hypothetical protein
MNEIKGKVVEMGNDYEHDGCYITIVTSKEAVRDIQTAILYRNVTVIVDEVK